MKRHWIAAFVTFLMLTLLAGTLVAKEDGDRRKRGDKPDARKRAGRRPGRRRKMPDIGLTDEQKKEIQGIRKDAMAKVKDAKPEDRQAIFKKMREDIGGVLTEEQREKMKKARQSGGPDRERPDLGLTDEQKEKMAVIHKEARAKMKDAKPGERKAIHEQMQKQIAELLTKEQLEKFKKFHQQRGRRGRGMPDIGLSDDQKAQIAEIRKKAHDAAKDAEPKDRRAIIEKMKKDIHALLTKEQIEKLKKARQDGSRRGKGRGRGDRGKGRRGGGDRPGKKRPDSK